MLEKLILWDQQMLLAVNGTHTPFWDVVMWNISLPLVWLPAYIILLYLCIRYYKWQTIFVLLFAVALIAMTDSISVHVFKDLFMRWRPTHEPALEGMVHVVNGYKGGDYGFVSSHACNYFGIAIFFSMIFRKNLRYFPFFSISIAALIAYSRVYLGVHYPGDVFCGALLGSLLGWGAGFGFVRFSRWRAKCAILSGEPPVQ